MICFESCDANVFFCDNSETRQTANRLGCQLWIWWDMQRTLDQKEINISIANTQWLHKRQSYAAFARYFSLCWWPATCRLQVRKFPSLDLQQFKNVKISWCRQDLQWFFRLSSAFFGFRVNSNCQKPFKFLPCQEANRLDLQPQRRLRQFLLEEGPSLLSYHVRETEFFWLAELDVGERHFEPIAGKTAEEAKKNAAMAAVQALKMEKSTMVSQVSRFHPFRPGTIVVGFNAKHVRMKSKRSFLGPNRPILSNIHRIRQRSHAKLKVISL